jgi:hypothetical protein
MVICDALAKKGFLRPTPRPEDYDPQDRSTWHYEPDDYIRTDKLPHDQLTQKTNPDWRVPRQVTIHQPVHRDDTRRGLGHASDGIGSVGSKFESGRH